MNITLKPAAIGTISHGTLRNVDLLDTFGNELEWQIRRNGGYFALPEQFAERDRLNTLYHDALELAHHMEEGKEDSEHASELVNTLSDTLGMFAPPYCYFGANPGDGSDFGYWPDMDSINELQKFNDLSDAFRAEITDDFQVVNDHGNVSVYSADGKRIIDIV